MILKTSNIKNWRDNLAALANSPKHWEDSYRPEHQYQKIVKLEFCLGELAEDGLKALALTGGKVPQTTPITGKEGFSAHGIEGKAIVELTLREAIIKTDILNPYRWRIVGV